MNDMPVRACIDGCGAESSTRAKEGRPAPGTDSLLMLFTTMSIMSSSKSQCERENFTLNID